VNHPPVVSLPLHSASEWNSFDLFIPENVDPDQPNSTLQYELDLDYDGVTFDGGPLIPITPAALGWDGPSSHTIALRVTDEKGAVSNIATTTIDVHNVTPLSMVSTADHFVDEGTTATARAQGFDVDPLTFRWHLRSTTSGQAIPDQTTPDLEFVADAGSYLWEFTVTDDEGASSFPLLLMVTARNIPPSVSVGPSQTVLEGSTVTMSSTVQAPSTDTLSYDWQQNNTNNQLFPLPDAPSFDFVPSDNGDYFFVLTVWDDELTSDTDFVQVTVLNAPPVVDAGADQTVLEGSAVTLSGSATDPGLDTLSYQWRLVSSSNGQSIPGQNTASFDFVPGDNGTYTFELTVTDDDGGSSTDTIVVTVDNVAPSVDAGSDQAVVEGSLVTLTGSATDPGADELFYHWQQVGSSNCQWIADQGTSSFNFVPADNGVYTFQLTVTDDDGGSSTDMVVITVNNALPTASISGASSGVAGQTLSFQVDGDDASAADLAAGFTYQIDWGDGSAVESLAGGSSLGPVNHVFANTGTYVVQVTSTDKDGGQSTPATWNVDIAHTLISGGILYVGGSDGNDTIAINAGGGSGSVAVAINGLNQGTFSALSRVVVYGGAGNDVISVQSNVLLDAWLFGGGGNDVLSAGRGNDVLAGGAGNDILAADRGFDLLIGGLGQDVLSGGQDDDILIGGTSNFDRDEAALAAIVAEWTSPRSFLTRKANLENGSGSPDRLNDAYFLQLGSTVFDDGENDTLSGGPGSNWSL